MTFNVIALIAFVTIPAFAAWFFGYNSKPNKRARELLADKEEKEFLQKAKEQEAGREKNRREVLKTEVLQILDAAVRDPQRLRGMRPEYPHNQFDHTDIREFIEKSIAAINHSGNGQQALDELRTRVIKQSELIRDLQGQLKEINKALQLGQPVE